MSSPVSFFSWLLFTIATVAMIVAVFTITKYGVERLDASQAFLAIICLYLAAIYLQGV